MMPCTPVVAATPTLTSWNRYGRWLTTVEIVPMTRMHSPSPATWPREMLIHRVRSASVYRLVDCVPGSCRRDRVCSKYEDSKAKDSFAGQPYFTGIMMMETPGIDRSASYLYTANAPSGPLHVT